MTTKYFTCPNCHEPTRIKSMATDRVELERDRGETFAATCAHCHRPLSVHVNDVMAAPNKIVTGAGAAAGVVATAALWQLGFVAYLSLALPVMIYGAQQKAAGTFNGYRITPTKRRDGRPG